MRHYILEGPDRVGKTTLANALAAHFASSNTIIYKHFTAPPPGVGMHYQFNLMYTELEQIQNLDPNTVIIWDRAHIGEFVYGSLYRRYNIPNLLGFIRSFEMNFIESTYMYILTAPIQYLMTRDDGKSINHNNIAIEQTLFNMAPQITELQHKVIETFDNDQHKSIDQLLHEVFELSHDQQIRPIDFYPSY
jgi:thymidylate kinase